MYAISNEEMERLPKLGKTIKCHICGKRHVVDNRGWLAFFLCGERAYLCGVDGRKFILKNGGSQCGI